MKLFYITYERIKGYSPYACSKNESSHVEFELWDKVDIDYAKWKGETPDIAPVVGNSDGELRKKLPRYLRRVCFTDPKWPAEYVKRKNAEKERGEYALVLMSFDFPVEGDSVEVEKLPEVHSCANCAFSYEYDDDDGDNWPDSCVLFNRTQCGMDAKRGGPHVWHCDHRFVCPLWKAEVEAEEVKP